MIGLPRRAGEPAPFNQASIAAAPQSSGVYFLYRGHRVLYIGIAVHGTSIRQELEKHLSGLYGARTCGATSFDFEQTRDPVIASGEYLLAHMAQNGGRLPPGNHAEAAPRA